MADRVNCMLDGGVLLLDKVTLDSWQQLDPTNDMYPPTLFSIALDVEGKTDQVYDWPNEDWRVVWQRETQALIRRVNGGEIGLFILHQGVFTVDLSLDAPMPLREGLVDYTSRITITSGVVVIAEPGALMQDWGLRHPPEYDTFTYREVSAGVGSHTLHFLVPRHVASSREGRVVAYGTDAEPALYVRLTRADKAATPIQELFHADLSPPAQT